MRLPIINRRWPRVMAFALAAAALTVPACKDNTGPGTTVLVFLGTVNGASGSLSGQITLTITGTAVAGTFKIVAPTASTHTLTGTYNTSTKAMSASGGGYTFAGTYDGSSKLDGTMSGTATGTFVASKDNSSVSFCGTYSGSDQGVWSFTVSGTALHGSATSSNNGTVTVLDGTISGSTITIPGLATGTVSGTSASGTWASGSSSGNWTGTKCN